MRRPGAEALRHEMVKTQIVARGIRDRRVLDAMRSVPRHCFIPGVALTDAYADHPIGIGQQQTISQPFIVALMTELLSLEGTETVLEIGTGSGYQAAILATIVPKVVTVERIPELQSAARDVIESIGLNDRVTFRTGDGGGFTHPEAPFDRILVTAAADELPAELLAQLGDPGILVAPVGPTGRQELIRIVRRNGTDETTREGGCAFVPLIRG